MKKKKFILLFFSGIITGLGRALGLIIIFGIIYFLLYLMSISDIMWINNFVDWPGLKQYVTN